MLAGHGPFQAMVTDMVEFGAELISLAFQSRNLY